MANDNSGHTTGTQVPGAAGHADVFPPFDANNFAPQLVWLALTFGALYLLMSKIALPRVAGILDARSTKISSELDSAKHIQTQAAEAGRVYEQVLSDGKAHAQTLTQNTQNQMTIESDAKRRALEAELNAKLVAAEKQIAGIRDSAMANVEDIARGAASAIVKQLTGKSPDDDSVAKAVSAARQG